MNKYKNITFIRDIYERENNSTEFFNLVLFDLDGTMIDSGRGIMNTLTYVFETMGRQCPDRDTLRKFIGPPLVWSFKNLCGFDDEATREGVAIYREHYPKGEMYNNDVYDGVKELIKFIKEQGAVLEVATSKPEPFAKKIIEHIGLTEYFDAVIGSGMDNTRSTKSEVVAYALKTGKDILKNDTTIVNPLMIGDRHHDIDGAHENNIKCAAVLSGYGNTQEFEKAGADYILSDMRDKRWFAGV